MILIAFFAVENIADATFTSNRGLYFMMFMGIIYANMKQRIRAHDIAEIDDEIKETKE